MSAIAPPVLALLQQAASLQRQGRHAQALPLLRHAAERAPSSSDVWEALGVCLKDCGRYEEAIEAFTRALQHPHPRPHELQLHRAVIFTDALRRDEDALSALKAALSLRPDYLPALLNLGNLHEQRGEREAALACYAHAQTDPAFARGPYAALRGVAMARSAVIRPPATLDDQALQRLGSAAASERDPMVRVHLQFALGHALDRLGATDSAFAAFAAGNKGLQLLHGRRYDRVHEQRLNEAIRRAFPAAQRPASARVPAAVRPLFICGMFRSGSTLLEQVLAAHPEVEAGGEIDWLLRVAAERMAPFPASVAQLDDARAAALGIEYLETLKRLFPGAPSQGYITDKRPDNFQIIGLIKRLVPSAKIIHTIRHPVDNGLSVFMQHMNAEVTPYATDLGDIAHYYGEYRALMSHWKRLYPDDIHDFDYDAFVRDPEAQLRPLLSFLGLDWDARCLAFHTVKNTVKTASYWQVRQPLYGGASGRWRRYLPHLAPLIEGLQAAGIDADAA